MAQPLDRPPAETGCEYTADYVIVGAGSAGAVLAARLSEDPATRVLLLEAGVGAKPGGKNGAEDWLLRMPLGFLKALFNPAFTWPYKSEPEAHLNGRQLYLPRGKLLGGSSAINGMFYMRGHSSDFDGWAQKGCSGWSYADVLPYFLKMERHWAGGDGAHGDSGPLAVTRNATRHLMHEEVMAAARNAGLPITEDLHTDEEGVARGELTIDENGNRASTYAAYLKPAMARPNLQVITGALAEKVLVENRRATGIAFTREGTRHIAHATREVILSGGSYNSPHLLMLSGIGPADELREHGIAVVHDLPGVGRNLSEHPRVPVEFAAKGAVTFVNQLRFDRAVRHVLAWKLRGKGAFAAQVNSANPILRTDPRLAQPDIQLWCNPVKVGAHMWFPGVKAAPKHEMTTDVILLHPQARGRVTLRSADPRDAVKITLNIFDNQADFATARAGIAIARKLYGTAPLSGMVDHETLPGTQVTSDAALDEHIRATAQVTQHPVGTCAMGTGPNAVVDPELRVHGIEALRVIDASIMPDVPGGNTNAPTIMIAEKAADLIRGRSLARLDFPAPPQPGRRVTRDDFEHYLAAFNRDDFAGFSRFYAEDVEFNLGDRKRIIGRQGIVDFYRGVKAHIREELTILDLVVTPTRIALHNRTVFTTFVDWPDFELWPTHAGDVRRIESINLYEVENDRFTRIKSARYKEL